ncbi:MAG: hypothetical protein EOO46_08035 [Flavobacterium sp.]|nr:MAG: hypothetical protein EOO46_08035 [Flavobacterium sp.]
MTKSKVQFHGYIGRQIDTLLPQRPNVSTPWAMYTGKTPLEARRKILNSFRRGLVIDLEDRSPYLYEVKGMYIGNNDSTTKTVQIMGQSYSDVLEGLAEEAIFYQKHFSRLGIVTGRLNELVTDIAVLERFSSAAKEAGKPENPIIIAEDVDLLINGMIERERVFQDKIRNLNMNE